MIIIIYHYNRQQFLDKPCCRISGGGNSLGQTCAGHVSCIAYLLTSEVEEHSH